MNEPYRYHIIDDAANIGKRPLNANALAAPLGYDARRHPTDCGLGE